MAPKGPAMGLCKLMSRSGQVLGTQTQWELQVRRNGDQGARRSTEPRCPSTTDVEDSNSSSACPPCPPLMVFGSSARICTHLSRSGYPGQGLETGASVLASSSCQRERCAGAGRSSANDGFSFCARQRATSTTMSVKLPMALIRTQEAARPPFDALLSMSS